MKMLSRPEISALTGVPTSTIGLLQQTGLIPQSGQMTMTQALAVAVARGLSARGVGSKDAGDVLEYIWGLHEERLEACFARGACFIAIFGTKPCPRLVDMESVTRNPAVHVATAWAAGLVPALVDVQLVWERLKEGLKKLRGGEKATTQEASVEVATGA